MISKNRICDITKSWRFLGITISFLYIAKSIFYTKKKKNQVYFLIYHKIEFVILLCIEVSFRILSITTFNCQKPKAQA